MGWWAVVQGILTAISVAQGIKSYRQAKKLEREANQLLIQKYGTGGGIPVVYGTRRIAGTVVFADTVNNRELFVVYALCVGEVTDITNIQIGGRSIFDKSVFDHALVRKSNYYGQTQQEINNILANQNPPNKPRMVFNCHMGEDDQVADPMLVGCVPGWTSAHQLKGITYLACNFDYDSGGGMFNGLPEITCTVQGKKLYDPTKDSTVTNGSGSHRQDDTSTHEYSDNTSLVLLDYLTNSQYGKGIPYSAIDIQSFITSTNRHTTSTNVNHSATVQSIVQQQDLVTLARTSANLSVFNKIKVGNTITITGGGTTYASGIVMDKATNTRHTDGERTYKSNTPGYDIPYDVMYEIYLNNGAVQTAVDFSETPVFITINENGKRFPFNGVIDTDKTIFENVKDINANMRGIFTYTNGQYSLKIEDSESVTLSIDDDDILSSGITVNLENKADIYNIVEVEFANAQKDYELDTASYKHVSATSGQDYTYDDNGEELKLAIDMPFITSQAIAYQYARAILKRSRNNKEIAFQGTPKLLNAKVGEIISVTNSELGMNAEQYRITEMTINSDLTVQVNAIIYQSDIYGFVTPPGETIDIPDDPVDSFRVDTPTNLNFVDKDPSTGVQPYLTWNNSSNYPAYEFRVVIKDSSSNVLYDGRTKNTHFDLSGIQVANGYTAEVQAINTNRVESEVATYNFNNSVPPVQNNDLGDSSVTDSKVADISADKIDTGVLNLGTESGMAVRQGKTGYASTTTGFWLGNDSGTPKFHIGTSSNFLKFDGSALNIQGDLTATTGLIGGWTVDANSIFAGTKDVSGYTTTGITISSANNGSIHAKQFYIDSSGNANFKGSIFGGSIRADVTNPIPTDIFTRTNNQSIPTSTENGAFIDLSAGKFVFGDASKFISFNGSELDVKGVLAPTILDLTGTADTNLPSNIKATAVTDGSIGVGALKQAVWNEIDSRVGTGTGGFYVTATDNYLGEATKYITIATAPDHGTETVTLEVIINDSFGAPISFSYGNIATAIDVTLEFKKTTDSTWSTAGSTQRFYANPTPTNYITIYSIDETYSVELTSGVGNDLENGTDYDFRVVIERADTTAQQSVFKAYPGGANDSNGTPIVLEAREGSVGAGQGDLFTSQYIYHSGDADTHIEFQEDIINIDAGSVNFATFESASQNTITLKEDVIMQKNLTVLGTQTTLNTQILDVEDNNITLNYSSGDSSGSANGSGITIQDAVDSSTDATILWDTANDEFDFSHPINTSGITSTGNVAASGTVSGQSLSVSSSGYGSLELGGVSGAFIDLKRPNSDDFDLRLITTGTGGQIVAPSGATIDMQIVSGTNILSVSNTGINVTGNISVTGTVDGRDVATDGSKLDGIEAGATTDQTASEILTAIKTVDGSGSGLDADLFDGLDSTSFRRRIFSTSINATPETRWIAFTKPHISGSGSSEYYHLDLVGYSDIGQTQSSLHYSAYIHVRSNGTSTNTFEVIIEERHKAGSEQFTFGKKQVASTSNIVYFILPEDYSGVEIYNLSDDAGLISTASASMFSTTDTDPTGITSITPREPLHINDNITVGTISSGAISVDGSATITHADSTAYSDSPTWTAQTFDTLKVYNDNGGSAGDNHFASIYMRADGGGNASARIILRNDDSGNGRLYFQMRSGSHTSETKPKMLITDDGQVAISDNATTYNERLFVDGNLRVEGVYKSGTQTIIDASRNLTNIGTISSGAITSTGNATFNSNQFKIQNPSPTLILKDTTDDDDHQIQFRDNNDALLFAIQTQNADTGDALTFYSVADEIVHRVGSTNRLTVDSLGIDVTGTVTSDGLTVDGDGSFSSDLTVQGTLSAGTIAPDSVNTDTLNTESIIFDSGSTNIGNTGARHTTTSSTSQTSILNMSASFTSVKFQVQITDATTSSFHVTEIMVLNDGTNQYISEYGTITTGSALATFDADKTATNLRLLATPTTSNTLAYKIIYQAIYS